jgi:bifunctional polynucleotide phosphatase/kinase
MQYLAVFDFDWTIVKPKYGRTFPTNKDDWCWWHSSVPQTLKSYSDEGYKLVFLTDQTKDWKVDMINDVISVLNLDIEVIISFNKKTNKPNPELFLSSITCEYVEKESFYVGDAGGRVGDWSNVDKDVARALKLPFYVPENIFFDEEVINENSIEPVSHLEVIIMVGYQGSGKSTLCKTLPSSYKIISGDIYNTPVKMLKSAKQYINNYSIVFDSTNPSIERRRIFINFAEEYGRPVRCIWSDVDIDVAISRISKRVHEGGAHVPKIALYIFRKKFEEPNEDFENLTVVRIS